MSAIMQADAGLYETGPCAREATDPYTYNLERHTVNIVWNPLAGEYQCESCRDGWTAQEYKTETRDYGNSRG